MRLRIRLAELCSLRAALDGWCQRKGMCTFFPKIYPLERWINFGASIIFNLFLVNGRFELKYNINLVC